MYAPDLQRLPPGARVLPPGTRVLPPGTHIPPPPMPPYRVYDGEPRVYAGYTPSSGYHPIPYAGRAFDSPGATSYGDYDRQRSKHSKSSSGKKHKRQEKERNTLSEWKDWRTSINNDLSKDILRHSYNDIPVGDDFKRLKRSSKHHGRSVYHYSTAEDQATGLAKDDYINFGIPRASAPAHAHESSSDESDGDNRPFYSIKKLNGLTEPARRERHSEHRSPLNGRDADVHARYFSPRR